MEDGVLKYHMTPGYQCFLFSRNIGKLTPKKIYLHYLKCFFGSKYPKKYIFKFENRSIANCWVQKRVYRGTQGSEQSVDAPNESLKEWVSFWR